MRKLQKATQLQERIDDLNDQIDAILEPIVKKVIEVDHPKYTQSVLGRMPHGYYRTELRTWHITKQIDDPVYLAKT